MPLLPFGSKPFKTPFTITNAPVSGTPGSADQINTGDPNTKGLILKGNTYFPSLKTPSQVTGLFSWYKADALVLANGANVLTWPDSSGNGYTQTNQVVAPIFRTGVLNGLPVVDFLPTGGRDNVYMKGASPTISSPYVVIAVLTVTLLDANTSIILQSSDGNMAVLVNATTQFQRIRAGTSLQSAAALTNQYFIYTAIFNGASGVIRTNGTQVASGNVGTSAATSLWVSGASPNNLPGRLAELMVYNTLVSNGDILALEGYLASKYNITIPAAVYQTADLQENQSALGTVLSGIDGSGRLLVATQAGTPTGTPAAGTMIYDITAHKLWVYDAGWKFATFA